MEMSDNEVHESENKERIVMGSKGKKDVRKKRVVEVVDSRYQPTKAEMEEEIAIDASPEELARAVLGDVEVRVVKRKR